jgi:hypothetical protein
VKNPYNAKRVRRISLVKEDIEAFVFWTRYPNPLFKSLDWLDQHQIPYYFLITVNNYPSILEPYLPEITRVTDTIARLCQRIGKDRIIWRYDPLVLTDRTPVSFHQENFSTLVKQLNSFCSRVIVSTIDFYSKVKRRFQKAGLDIISREDNQENYDHLLGFIAGLAMDNGLEIQSCAESVIGAEVEGIQNGKCIDNDLLNRLFSLNIAYKKDKNQRPRCLCHQSVDIGSYNTCTFNCLFFYAC